MTTITEIILKLMMTPYIKDMLTNPSHLNSQKSLSTRHDKLKVMNKRCPIHASSLYKSWVRQNFFVSQ